MTTTNTGRVGIPISKPDTIVRVALVGQRGTGKCSLVRRFSEDTFDADRESNDFFVPRIVHIDGKIVKLFIDNGFNDFLRQEAIGQTCSPTRYRGTEGVLAIYDTTDASSFHKLRHCIEEVTKRNNKTIMTIVVGNKCDLTTERKVRGDVVRVAG